nr:unnamed protein product [Digitaria exilis]
MVHFSDVKVNDQNQLMRPHPYANQLEEEDHVQSSKAVKPTYGVGGAPSASTDTAKVTMLDKVNFDHR